MVVVVVGFFEVVVVVGFFVVVVAAGFLVVSAAVADAGLFVAEPVLFAGLFVAAPVLFAGLLDVAPVLFAGLLDVAAEELLSCLFVEGFDVSEEASDELFCLSELSADELFCLSELSDDELFCLSELVLSEASDEVSEDEPLPEEAVSCDTVSAEDTAEAVDELSADNVPLSALQPQADMISAAHSIREMIRFFIFLFLFHFRLPAVNVIRQDLYSITLRLYYTNTQKSRPNFSYFAFRDYEQLERSQFITYSQNSRTSLAKLT